MFRPDFATLVLVASLTPVLMTLAMTALRFVWGYEIGTATIISPMAILGAMASIVGVGLFISARFVGG